MGHALPFIAALLMPGQLISPAVGERVIVRHPELLETGREIEDETISYQIFTVMQVRGGGVLLKDGQASGWLPGGEVIPESRALDFLTSEIARHPGEANPLARRGMFLALRGDKDRGLADLDEAVRLDPKNPLNLCCRAYARMERDPMGAIEDTTAALAIDPKSIANLNTRASLRLATNDYHKAIDDLTRSIELDPTDSRVYYNRGKTRAGLGDEAGALRDYNTTLFLDPASCQARVARAILVGFRAGEGYERALRDCDEAIEINPKYRIAYEIRAELRRFHDQIPAAIEDWNVALELDPKNAEGYIRRGFLRGKLGMDTEAVDDFSAAIRINQVNPMPRYHRATSCVKTRDFATALADCEAIVGLDGLSKFVGTDRDLQSAYILRAWLLASCPDGAIRDGKKALESAMRAVEIDESESADVADVLAAAHAERGEFAAAVKFAYLAIVRYRRDENDAALALANERLEQYKAKHAYCWSGGDLPGSASRTPRLDDLLQVRVSAPDGEFMHP